MKFFATALYVNGKLLKKSLLVLIAAMMTTALLSGVVIVVGKNLLSQGVGFQGLTIGVLDEGNDPSTKILLDMLTDMDSLEDYCTFALFEDAQEAEWMLEKGEINALAVLPVHFMEDILTGKNTMPRLLVDASRPLESSMILWLAQSATDMLSSAQNGIYTVLDSYQKSDPTVPQWDKAVTQINFSYINWTLNRGQLYEVQTVYPTGSLSIGEHYFLTVGLSFLVLTAGLCYRLFAAREQWQVLLRLKGAGGSVRATLWAKAGAGGLFYSIVTVFVLLVGMCFGVEISIPLLLGAVSCGLLVGAIGFACCNVVKSCYGAILLLVTGTAVAAFVAGALVPPVFLPQAVRILQVVSPIHWMRSVMAPVFGKDSNPLYLLFILLVTVGLTVCTVWRIERALLREGMGPANKRTAVLSANKANHPTSKPRAGVSRKAKSFFATAFWLHLKRLLQSKGLLASLAALPLLILLLGGVQRGAQASATIKVGVCMEEQTPEGQALLAAVQQIQGEEVTFAEVKSREELEDLVAAGKLECGYLLPKDLAERIAQSNYEGIIELIVSPATSLAPLTNEMFSAGLMRLCTPRIAYDYLQRTAFLTQKPSYEEVENQIEGYFAQETEMNLEIAQKQGTQISPPSGMKTAVVHGMVRGTIAVFMLLSAVLASLPLLEDVASGVTARLLPYRSKAVFVCAQLTAQAVLGTAGGTVALLAGEAVFDGLLQGFWREATAMLAYQFGLVCFGLVLSMLCKNRETIMAFVPFGFVGCFLLCPVLVDVARYMPVLAPLCNILLPTAYLQGIQGNVGALVHLLLLGTILLVAMFAAQRLRRPKLPKQ